VRRRDFIKVVASSATIAWSLAARAQWADRERRRRLGVLMGDAETDPEGQARIGAFRQALHWTDTRNLQIEYRWAAAMPD
jgi:putative tryptophan/tyrosine transport system substrate-binding protein